MASPKQKNPLITCQSDAARAGVNMHTRAGRLLLVALWFALLAGFAEVAIGGIERTILYRPIQNQSVHAIWMAPLASACLFVAVALLLLPPMWLWPRLFSERVTNLVFAFLAFMGPFLLFVPQLHKYAALGLALGLATQVSRFVTMHSQDFHMLVRRTLGGLICLVGALALYAAGSQFLAERRSLAQLPTASPTAPNVLFIVLDTVRAASLSVYGHKLLTTPALEGFAKTGVLFERAYSTSPWTLPSHASMFTGRFPHELSANWLTPLNADYPTLAQVLSANGYFTGGFVANTSYCSYESGLQRGFTHYEDYRVSPAEVILSSVLGRTIANHNKIREILGYYDLLGRKDASVINRDFLAWLSQHTQRPFFAFLNYFDAHMPYLPPPPFDGKFGPKTRNGTYMVGPAGRGAGLVERNMSQRDVESVRTGYESAIAYLDAHLGILFDELRHRNLLENTLVIITSDHGEQFGENGLFEHGNSLYKPLLHVPLLIAFPGRIPAGVAIQEPVTLRDLAATIAGLLEIEDGTVFPGQSLAQHWDQQLRRNFSGSSPLFGEVRKGIRRPASYPVSKGDMHSLIEGKYHYIKNGDGREELYDTTRDPLEQHDLAQTMTEPTLEHFKATLETILMNRQIQPITARSP